MRPDRRELAVGGADGLGGHASARDLITIVTNRRRPDGTLDIVMASIEDARFPPQPDKVRATVKVSGWRLKPRNDGTDVAYGGPACKRPTPERATSSSSPHDLTSREGRMRGP